ncbi:MAG: DUF4382 domain-containing protein [Bdellovibrio sp.]
MKSLVSKVSVFSIATLITACNPGGSSSTSLGDATAASSSQAAAAKNARVSFKLVDAPNKELKSVIVNIDHMEVVLAGKGKAGRLILAQNLGQVDLLQLQNGVSLPLQDVVAPEGLRIQQIRLILNETGHYAVKEDDSICELKTPSAQKSGVKIILTNKVQFEAGHIYNVIVDFDAKQSVVQQGNGGCLLKPVLKLKSVTKQVTQEPIPTPDVEPSPTPTPTPVVEPSPEPTPDAPIEIITTPDMNDPYTDDGYTPIIDGQEPIVTESELGLLL